MREARFSPRGSSDPSVSAWPGLPLCPSFSAMRSVEMHREGGLPPYAYLALGWHSQSCLTADKLLDHNSKDFSVSRVGSLQNAYHGLLYWTLKTRYYLYWVSTLEHFFKANGSIVTSRTGLLSPLQTLVHMGGFHPLKLSRPPSLISSECRLKAKASWLQTF